MKKIRDILDIHFPQPLLCDIPGLEMKKIPIFDFYAWGVALDRLRWLNVGEVKSPAINIIADAQKCLRSLVDGEDNEDAVPIRFKSCVPAAQKLLTVTYGLLVNKTGHAGGKPAITAQEMAEIKEYLYQFEILFKQECAEIETFAVSEKGILSTSILISRAENAFSLDELKRLPQQAVDDIRRSGRCIAFELPTSSGFHAFRALESVILDYLTRLNEPQPQNRNLGEYIRVLEQKGSDKKIISTLRQLKDNYRNPLFHPSENLDAGEDIDVFNLSKSAISAILKDMDKKGFFPAVNLP
jgi:hypothetical protein